MTNFVYDLTVVEAGRSNQYILKPQIDQSGADQDFIKVKPEVQPENKGKSKGNNKGGNSTPKIGSHPNLWQAIKCAISKEQLLSGYDTIGSTT